jgi:hypothetical protein
MIGLEGVFPSAFAHSDGGGEGVCGGEMAGVVSCLRCEVVEDAGGDPSTQQPL